MIEVVDRPLRTRHWFPWQYLWLFSLVFICLTTACRVDSQVLVAPPTAPSMAASQPQAQTLPIRDLSWDDLAPKGWDPIEEVHQALQSKQLSMFSEESKPEIRKVLDQAPPNLPLDGVVARIGGYVVPLEGGEHGLTELMLVNYFGASTQSPAPAANQIVHVYLSSPHSGLHTMDMVWVTGKLIVQRTKTFRGISDYRLNAEVVERKADGAASSAR